MRALRIVRGAYWRPFFLSALGPGRRPHAGSTTSPLPGKLPVGRTGLSSPLYTALLQLRSVLPREVFTAAGLSLGPSGASALSGKGPTQRTPPARTGPDTTLSSHRILGPASWQVRDNLGTALLVPISGRLYHSVATSWGVGPTAGLTPLLVFSGLAYGLVWPAGPVHASPCNRALASG